MTSHEIRESVIGGLSAEATVRAYFEEQESELLTHFSDGLPTILLQAKPLISTADPIDVRCREVTAVFQGTTRRRSSYGYITLETTSVPRTTLEGIRGSDSEDPAWIVDLHKSGYIGSAWRIRPFDFGFEGGPISGLGPDVESYFRAFASFCDELTQALDLSSTFAVRARMLRADSTSLVVLNAYGQPRQAIPCSRPTLRWPDRTKAPGDSFQEIASTWWHEMHNAFGRDAPRIPVR